MIVMMHSPRICWRYEGLAPVNNEWLCSYSLLCTLTKNMDFFYASGSQRMLSFAKNLHFDPTGNEWYWRIHQTTITKPFDIFT